MSGLEPPWSCPLPGVTAERAITIARACYELAVAYQEAGYLENAAYERGSAAWWRDAAAMLPQR